MRNNLHILISKWCALLSVFLQESMAYPVTMLIWILPEAVTGAIMPQVWSRASNAGFIQGFTTSDFVLYYVCMLSLSGFVTSHLLWDISVEIKEGIFSASLMRPVSYFQYSFWRNFAWRICRATVFLPILGFLLWLYRGHLAGAHVVFDGWFWVCLILGHFLSFTYGLAMAMVALFVQEAQSVFELYYFPMVFLSGQVFPVAVMPAWVQWFSKITPFYYTIGAPTEMLIGRTRLEDKAGIVAAQLLWIGFAYLAYRWMWAKGLRQYAAVGM